MSAQKFDVLPGGSMPWTNSCISSCGLIEDIALPEDVIDKVSLSFSGTFSCRKLNKAIEVLMVNVQYFCIFFSQFKHQN